MDSPSLDQLNEAIDALTDTEYPYAFAVAKHLFDPEIRPGDYLRARPSDDARKFERLWNSPKIPDQIRRVFVDRLIAPDKIIPAISFELVLRERLQTSALGSPQLITLVAGFIENRNGEPGFTASDINAFLKTTARADDKINVTDALRKMAGAASSENARVQIISEGDSLVFALTEAGRTHYADLLRFAGLTDPLEKS